MANTTGFSLDFLNQIQRLHQEQRTGLILITAGGKVIQISLEQGKIVYLAYSDKRGAEALPMLRDINGGKLRFIEGPITASRSPLPATPEILSYLSTDQPASAQKLEAPALGQQLSAQTQVVLRQKLAEFIGPMAAFICEERLVGVSDLDTALTTLSQVLPKPEQIDLFKKNVRQQLG